MNYRFPSPLTRILDVVCQFTLDDFTHRPGKVCRKDNWLCLDIYVSNRKDIVVDVDFVSVAHFRRRWCFVRIKLAASAVRVLFEPLSSVWGLSKLASWIGVQLHAKWICWGQVCAMSFYRVEWVVEMVDCVGLGRKLAERKHRACQLQRCENRKLSQLSIL